MENLLDVCVFTGLFFFLIMAFMVLYFFKNFKNPKVRYFASRKYRGIK